MKLSKVKYFFALLCLFCLMEKTGISAVSLFSHIKVMVSEPRGEKQANDTEESREAKQLEIKEYWTAHQYATISLPPAIAKLMPYHREASQRHYNWCPPVPTPPPNFNV